MMHTVESLTARSVRDGDCLLWQGATFGRCGLERHGQQPCTGLVKTYRFQPEGSGRLVSVQCDRCGDLRAAEAWSKEKA